MIKISSLVHKYTIWQDENIKSEKTALDGISLDIPSGQFLAILGPNGSGKSTLAKHLNVLLLPNEGTVWIEGNDTASKEKLWEIRSQVGMVFQNPDNQIIGTSVEEDVAFGPENKNIESEKIRKIVRNVLLKVGLWSKRKSSPMKLSGGQKQKLAIADALASNPGCLVLDEPTAMLDPASRKEVIKIAHELNQKEKMTIVLITHHTDEVVDADRIILMKEGKFFYTGTSDEIILSMDMFVWNCIIPKSELNNYMKKYLIGNVRTVSDGVELRVLSKMPPTGNAVQVEATLEDAFLLYFGEKAGDKDDVQI